MERFSETYGQQLHHNNGSMLLHNTIEDTQQPMINKIAVVGKVLVQELFRESNTKVAWIASQALLLAASLMILRLVVQLRTRWLRRGELERWIESARTERNSKVHQTLRNVPPMGNSSDWKLWTAAETRARILAGTLDPADNIRFLSQRCRRYGREETGVNAITEEFYDQAHATAMTFKTREPSGSNKAPLPLLGVPVVVKDCVGLKGTWSTGGMACRLNQRDTHDSLVMTLVQAAGAIPLCKGNVVQGMGLSEGVNRIWGRSRNPWNLARSPGGSSAGDACLVSMGAVPLSVSADGAGSIRIPASCCGVVGFKPTSHRMTFQGCMRPKKDNKFGSHTVVPATIGPMARCVEDCAMFAKAVWVPELWQGDRNLPPLPFNEQEYNDTKPLTIGYFTTDGWMDPCPTAKRALHESIAALEAQGYTCVPFQPPTNGWETVRLFVSITAAEGNLISFKEALEGEPMIPEYLPLVGAASIPSIFRSMARMIMPKRISHLLGCSKNGGLSSRELWDAAADLLTMKQKWSDAVNAAGVDALIFPALPLPAIRHGNCGKIMSVSYMFLANLLVWPSGVLPITTVRPDEQHYPMSDLPSDQRDIMSWYAAQEMKGSQGLPISISVMTPAFEDEKCLRVMKDIEKGVGFSARPAAFELFNPSQKPETKCKLQ